MVTVVTPYHVVPLYTNFDLPVTRKDFALAIQEVLDFIRDRLPAVPKNVLFAGMILQALIKAQGNELPIAVDVRLKEETVCRSCGKSLEAGKTVMQFRCSYCTSILHFCSEKCFWEEFGFLSRHEIQPLSKND